jgi:hypothetical protein
VVPLSTLNRLHGSLTIICLKFLSFDFAFLNWVPSYSLLHTKISLISPFLHRNILLNCWQCCGSGSGSTCFWVSRIRTRIHLSEVWIRIRILLWIRILPSSCKNSKKNLDSYYFVTLFDFLSLKNDIKVASKSNKQKNFVKKNCFLLASWRSMTKIAGSGFRIRIGIRWIRICIRIH